MTSKCSLPISCIFSRKPSIISSSINYKATRVVEANLNVRSLILIKVFTSFDFISFCNFVIYNFNSVFSGLYIY